MAEIINSSMRFKDPDGNILEIKSLTSADIAKISQGLLDITNLKETVANTNIAQRQLALKDYRESENQTDMKSGIWYMLPVNATEQFVEFDLNTGKPKNPQTDPSVTDIVVTKYLVLFKSNEGTVATLGSIAQQPDFALFATLAGNNTFTGSNTFNNDITVTTGASQDVSSIEDTTLVAGKIVKDINTKVTTINANYVSIQVSNAAPEEGTLKNNVLYAYTASNLL